MPFFTVFWAQGPPSPKMSKFHYHFCGVSRISDPHCLSWGPFVLHPFWTSSFLCSISRESQPLLFVIRQSNWTCPGAGWTCPHLFLTSEKWCNRLLSLLSSPFSPSIGVSGLFSANRLPAQMFATNQEPSLRLLLKEVRVGFSLSWVGLQKKELLPNHKQLMQISNN